MKTLTAEFYTSWANLKKAPKTFLFLYFPLQKYVPHMHIFKSNRLFAIWFILISFIYIEKLL